MNDAIERYFQDRVERMVNPIVAGMRRKRRMREELLAHLCEAFEGEIVDGMDEDKAVRAALQRLGDWEQIKEELQKSVPWVERVLATVLFRKENQMSRFWMVWIATVMLAFALVFPQFVGGVVAALLAIGLSRYLKVRGPNARIMGALLGLFGVLFGTALILPALARWKRNGYWEMENGACALSGTLIVMAGLMLLVRSIAMPRARIA